MRSDIEIAQASVLRPITEIAQKAGIAADDVEQYGKFKAKINLDAFNHDYGKKGKLVLVTAITPTVAGEGKTTVAIGLADALQKIGKNSMVAMREPSLGPVFGMKGGATGGGYAQVAPMEDINLHFNGDIHAIGAANNLLAAMVDNHIFHGNELGIDPRKITWRRCVDMNDRQLRFITDGLGGSTNGTPREDGYDITVASEIMAILCLSSSIQDLKERLTRIIVGWTYDNRPVTAGDLNAQGSMTALLLEAIKPNLVQTLEGTPALAHGGPFANIAHGCNSLIATKLATKFADYTITEAGFGADLGAEKFLDIKCRLGVKPSAVVIVATVKALKLHGGADKNNLSTEDLTALEKGIPNLLRHISNIKNVYKLPCVIALNHFASDTDAEIELVCRKSAELGAYVALTDVHMNGGAGGKDLAEKVVELCEEENDFTYCYDVNDTIENKIKAVVTRIYGGDGIELSAEAKKKVRRFKTIGADKLPVCIAKTQYSFSDNKKLIGAPTGFTVNIRDLRLSAGAGFVVALAGEIMTMPGLPKVPAATHIDVDETGKITGLS